MVGLGLYEFECEYVLDEWLLRVIGYNFMLDGFLWVLVVDWGLWKGVILVLFRIFSV